MIIAESDTRILRVSQDKDTSWFQLSSIRTEDGKSELKVIRLSISEALALSRFIDVQVQMLGGQNDK